MPQILPEQLTGPGTRANQDAPWMTYDREMTEVLDPVLQAAVDEYSTRRHDKTSSQNQEELHRQKEMNDELAKQYQWLTPEEYADVEPRIGRVMSFYEFIGKLRAGGPQGTCTSEGCGVRCWYREHPHADKLTLLYSDYFGVQEPQVGCWVQHGMMPEYSIMRFDEHGVPINERMRGWRTCLLQLILKGVVSENLAHRVFGAARGPASERYLATLAAFRNRGSAWEAQTEDK